MKLQFSSGRCCSALNVGCFPPSRSVKPRRAFTARCQAVSEPGTSSSNGNGASSEKKRKSKSSWDAVEAGGGRGDGADYLFEVGRSQQYNINVDHGQNASNLDYLFTGTFLGHKSDIADGTLRDYEFRKFNNIVGDYYVAPAFLEKVTLHIAKNYLMDLGCIDQKTKVPLILGIWGEKGMGKTFQTELTMKKLGCEPIIMSAGELEHEWAGTPGRLIRERYRRAAEVSKVHGKLSCLIINDIDAGLGHFANTQHTVNNQIVVGTLMNICDDPKRVSIGQDWREQDICKRIPIIVTGNDFSKMFAPLIRCGRMDKFMWKPTRRDLLGVLHQMYKDDGLTESDMGTLLDRFPHQPLDFFGALRSSTYDNQIREWIEHDIIGGRIAEENENLKEMTKRLLSQKGLPVFKPVKLSVKMLVQEGERLENEQQMVKNLKLSDEYLKKQKGGPSLIGLKG